MDGWRIVVAERIVSVKMPSSLVHALDDMRKEYHYLDLSEQLRSIIRERCLELQNPYTTELKRLKRDLQQPGTSAREQVLTELIALLKEGER